LKGRDITTDELDFVSTNGRERGRWGKAREILGVVKAKEVVDIPRHRGEKIWGGRKRNCTTDPVRTLSLSFS